MSRADGNFSKPVSREDRLQVEKEKHRELVKKNLKTFRARRKQLDIDAGKCDKLTGRLVKPTILHPPADETNQSTLCSKICIASATNAPDKTRQRITKKTPQDPESGESLPLHPIRQRTNWFHPITWAAIDIAAIKMSFSPRGIVSHLKKKFLEEGTYDKLSPSTVSRWIDRPDGKKPCWNHVVRSNIEHNKSCWKDGTGRAGILDLYPETKQRVLIALQALRKTSIGVNVLLVHSIIMAHIQAEIPHIIPQKPNNPNDSNDDLEDETAIPFFSLTTTKNFLYKELHWSSRREPRMDNWHLLIGKNNVQLHFSNLPISLPNIGFTPVSSSMQTR
jgi:hypothetical protein